MAGSICTSCGKHVADTYTGVCRACLIDHYDDDDDDLRRVVHELEDWIRRAAIEGAEHD